VDSVIGFFRAQEDALVRYSACNSGLITAYDNGHSVNVTTGCSPLYGASGPAIFHGIQEGEDYEFEIPSPYLSTSIIFAYVSASPGPNCSAPVDLDLAGNYIGYSTSGTEIWFSVTGYSSTVQLRTCESNMTSTSGFFYDTCGDSPTELGSLCSDSSLVGNNSVPVTTSKLFRVVAGGDGVMVVYGYSCFPAHALITVRDRGVIRMDQLQAGDFVLGENGEWVEVVSWMHRDEEASLEFIELTHTNGLVTLSPDHFIWVIDEEGERQDVPAEQVQVGDWLLDTHGKLQQVQAIERVEHSGGVYAPLTSSGDILVDEILCSCFNALPLPAPFYHNTHQYGMIGTLPQRWWPTLFGSLENPSTPEYSPASQQLLALCDHIDAVWTWLF